MPRWYTCDYCEKLVEDDEYCDCPDGIRLKKYAHVQVYSTDVGRIPLGVYQRSVLPGLNKKPKCEYCGRKTCTCGATE